MGDGCQTGDVLYKKGDSDDVSQHGGFRQQCFRHPHGGEDLFQHDADAAEDGGVGCACRYAEGHYDLQSAS